MDIIGILIYILDGVFAENYALPYEPSDCI